MLKELIDLRAEFQAKQGKLSGIFEKAKKGTTGEYDFSQVPEAELPGATTQAKIDHINQLDKELNDIGQKIEKMAVVERASKNSDERAGMLKGTGMVHPSAGAGTEKKEAKSFGQMVTESKAWESRKSGQSELVSLDVEMKTLFERSAGWAPETTRTGLLVPYATTPIQVVDIMPTGKTDQSAIVYLEETTFTNGAVEKAEGAAYGESAFALTERTVTVQKLPVYIPVTDEQLEDVAGAQSYIDNRLRFQVMQRLDGQIVNGDGISPNLLGILAKSGLQTQAKGADPVPDAIHKALTKVRVTGRAMPDYVLLHPNDAQDIYLLRTVDGVYIWGSPSEAGVRRIWGKPIVECEALTEGTGLTGDFGNFSQLVTRRGMDMQIGYVNDDFIKGRKAVRLDMRVALLWTRGEAFCKVTGI